MLWGIFVAMMLAAVVVVAIPLYRGQGRITVVSIAAMVIVVALSISLYHRIGSPGAPSGASVAQSPEQQLASIEEMVASLEARLETTPGDLNGWKMLGRSQMQLRNYPKAIAAFERAVELEGSSNGETLINLGEAVLYSDETSINGRAGQLFESGLALSPNNSGGLFYGGFAAVQRGDKELAAERWETLLESSPPPEIRGILERKIVEWRGGDPDTVVSEAPAVAAASGPGIQIDVDIPGEVRASFDAANSVFFIARDPAQPSPPIAVVRKTLQEVDGSVSISDDNAMIRGRVPSAYAEVEIIVRLSRSGQPIAQSGDWFGQALVETANGSAVQITVDQQVP